MLQYSYMSDYLTQAKKGDLEAELKHRKEVIRPEIGERLQAARALGDLSENAEYQSSRDEQGKNEGRIQQLEALLKHAKVVERSGGDKVEFGATVVVKRQSDGTEKTYTVVDNAEADIAQDKISASSPIGSAMMGKSAGETFTMTTPRGDVDYEILSVQ